MFRKSSQVLPGDDAPPDDSLLDQPIDKAQAAEAAGPAVEYSSSHEIDIEDEGAFSRPKPVANILASVDEEESGETAYKTRSVDQHEELMRRLSTHKRNSKLKDDSFVSQETTVTSPVNNQMARRNSLRKSTQMIEEEFQNTAITADNEVAMTKRNSIRRISKIGFEKEASRASLKSNLAVEGVEADSAARLIDFERFKASGSIPRYPECAESCVNISEIDRSSSLVVFVSHRWLRADAQSEGW